MDHITLQPRVYPSRSENTLLVCMAPSGKWSRGEPGLAAILDRRGMFIDLPWLDSL